MESAVEHFRKCMVALGLNPDLDEALRETPERVVSFLIEATSNYRSLPRVTKLPVYDRNTELKITTFPAHGMSQLVFEGTIQFSSICAHHFLPYFGEAYIGYIPGESVLGLSKFPRIVDFFSKAPTTQEFLTDSVLQYTVSVLKPKFMVVLMRAQHSCVSCRGPRKSAAITITTSVYSPSFDPESSKREFLDYVKLAG